MNCPHHGMQQLIYVFTDGQWYPQCFSCEIVRLSITRLVALCLSQ